MTKEQLNKYITINYEEIQRIITVHVQKTKFDESVVLSNLYINLDKQLDKLTEDNIEGYIVQYCYRLKTWHLNRGIDLTEDLEINKLKSYGVETIFDDEWIRQKIYHIDDGIYETMQEDLIKAYYKEKKLNIVERKLVNDYFQHNIDSIAKMMEFYNMKNTNTVKVNKIKKQLLNEFREFVVDYIKM